MIRKYTILDEYVYLEEDIGYREYISVSYDNFEINMGSDFITRLQPKVA